ncbi:MAG TPA: PaaI family thioesterase [Acidimicrobiia bacterium]|nr:PaaI family thioesterase [Acidimicrobiia bacterium]
MTPDTDPNDAEPVGTDAAARRKGGPPPRRAAVEALAAAIRRLGDVAVETAVDPTEIAAVTAELDALTARLGRRLDTSPYSGLTGPVPDFSRPESPMPLNPIIGACSPVRPDVRLEFDGSEVRGTATLSKRFTGPPGFAHGGISAMLADQLVAVSSGAIGIRCVTKALHVRFRRPLPLGEPLELVGRCIQDGDDVTAVCEIRAGGQVAVEGTAELVTYERLAGKARAAERGPEAR